MAEPGQVARVDASIRLTIGELAERTDVATSALRYYEEQGLISSERNPAGHRRYLRATARRVAFVVFAQRVGLTLHEIREELAKLPQDTVPKEEDWNRLTRTWREGRYHIVEAADGRRAVSCALITSEPRRDAWPETSVEGLRLGVLLLGVERASLFPDGVYTTYHVPQGVRGWMEDLDQGTIPKRFGFSLLRNLIAHDGPLEPLVSWFLLPRGIDEPTPEHTAAIVEHANIRLPKWLESVLVTVWVTPNMHKMHHSRIHKETDSNYGNLFSCFDRLFRTYSRGDRAQD